MKASHSANNMVNFQTPSLIIFAVIQLQSLKPENQNLSKTKIKMKKIGMLNGG